jgi:hypothetical protein
VGIEEVGVTLPEGAADRFEQVLAGPATAELAQPELLPSRWARAAASCLPVDGAGLEPARRGRRPRPAGRQ